MTKKESLCPFCMPSVKKACFAETDNFKAIYNIAPILPGHCLIVPNIHVSSFLDVPDSYMTEMIVFSRKVIKALTKAFNTSSYDWTIQEGIAAGQTIEHMHIHIIPRKTNDLSSPGDWYPRLVEQSEEMLDSLERSKLNDHELKQVVEKLESIMKQQT